MQTKTFQLSICLVGLCCIWPVLELFAQDPLRTQDPKQAAEEIYEKMKKSHSDKLLKSYVDNLTWGLENDKMLLPEFEIATSKLDDLSCMRKLCKKIKIVKSILEAYKYHFKGDYNKMDIYFSKILDQSQYMDIQEYSIYLNIPGAFYYNRKKFDKAIIYFKATAEVHASSSDYSNEVASNINSIGLAYMHLGERDSAIHYFQKGLAITQQAGDSVWYGLISGNLAALYLKEKQYREAIPLLKKDAKSSLSSELYISGANAYAGLASCYINLNKPDSAIYYLNQAYQITLPFPNQMEARKNIFNGYIYFFEKQNQKDSIILYQKKLMKVSDSIYQKNQRKELEELRIQYKKIDAAKDLENLRKQQQLNNWIMLLLVAILLILLTVSILLYKKQSQIIKQKRALESSNRVKDKLFSIIGHDLRSPVSSLSGMLSLIELDMISQEEFRSFVPDLKRKFSALHETLENLLNWSKDQLQNSKSKLQPHTLNDIIENIYNLYHDIAISKSVDLQIKIDTNTEVLCDKNQITIIIRNFVNNAIKFTDSGGSVVIGLKELNDEVQISVSDTGIGLSEEQISRIMDQQEVVSTRGTQGEKGTGIGLMLCTEMIAKNNGRFWIESPKGSGSTFYFTLPKAASRVAASV